MQWASSPRRHSSMGVCDPARARQNVYVFLEPLPTFHHTALDRCCQGLGEGSAFRDNVGRLSGGALPRKVVSIVNCPSTSSLHSVCI